MDFYTSWFTDPVIHDRWRNRWNICRKTRLSVNPVKILLFETIRWKKGSDSGEKCQILLTPVKNVKLAHSGEKSQILLTPVKNHRLTPVTIEWPAAYSGDKWRTDFPLRWQVTDRQPTPVKILVANHHSGDRWVFTCIPVNSVKYCLNRWLHTFFYKQLDSGRALEVA